MLLAAGADGSMMAACKAVLLPNKVCRVRAPGSSAATTAATTAADSAHTAAAAARLPAMRRVAGLAAAMVGITCKWASPARGSAAAWLSSRVHLSQA